MKKISIVITKYFAASSGKWGTKDYREHVFQGGMQFKVRPPHPDANGNVWCESPEYPGWFVSIPKRHWKYSK